MGPQQLVQNLGGNLVSRIPLDTLSKANINSLDQVEKKIWRRAQVINLEPLAHFIMFSYFWTILTSAFDASFNYIHYNISHFAVFSL